MKINYVSLEKVGYQYKNCNFYRAILKTKNEKNLGFLFSHIKSKSSTCLYVYGKQAEPLYKILMFKKYLL